MCLFFKRVLRLYVNNVSPHIIKLVLSKTKTTIRVPYGTISGPNLWKIYVNDLNLTEKKTLKYADDTTLYSKVLKLDITALGNPGCYRLISIPDNGLQHAADKAIEWSQSLVFKGLAIKNY